MQFESHRARSCSDSPAQHRRPWGGVLSPLWGAECCAFGSWGGRDGEKGQAFGWSSREVVLGEVSSPHPTGTASIAPVIYAR